MINIYTSPKRAIITANKTKHRNSNMFLTKRNNKSHKLKGDEINWKQAKKKLHWDKQAKSKLDWDQQAKSKLRWNIQAKSKLHWDKQAKSELHWNIQAKSELHWDIQAKSKLQWDKQAQSKLHWDIQDLDEMESLLDLKENKPCISCMNYF